MDSMRGYQQHHSPIRPIEAEKACSHLTNNVFFKLRIVVSAVYALNSNSMSGSNSRLLALFDSLYKALYELVVQNAHNNNNNNNNDHSGSIQWAVAVIDAAKVDEINILQATMLGMRLVAETIMFGSSLSKNDRMAFPLQSEASIAHSGCYLVRSSYKVGTEASIDVIV